MPVKQRPVKPRPVKLRPEPLRPVQVVRRRSSTSPAMWTRGRWGRQCSRAFTDPYRPGGAHIEGHGVDISDLLAQPHRSGRKVIDVDYLLQKSN